VTPTTRPSELTLRPYRDADEEVVLALLRETLGAGPGGDRSSAFFRWKHHDNPFGPSFILLAEAEGRIVGVRAFLRWRFQWGDRTLRAVRAVDTATHPSFQGRGVFSRLTREALTTLGDDVDLVFNTPNDRSLPGYLKMGWRIVGRVPISVRVRRPVALMTGGLRRPGPEKPVRPMPPVSAATAAEVLADDRMFDLVATVSPDPRRLVTPREVAFLRWRYGAAPLLGYRAIPVERGGKLEGVALFRVRARGGLWESTLAEVVASPGAARASRTLLGAVPNAAPVDHVTCSFPSGSVLSRAARRRGFLRVPGGVLLVANPRRQDLPSVTDLRAWALSLGDVEVF
jgi:GNAT superfamily N-acetyltransferase